MSGCLNAPMIGGYFGRTVRVQVGPVQQRKNFLEKLAKWYFAPEMMVGNLPVVPLLLDLRFPSVASKNHSMLGRQTIHVICDMSYVTYGIIYTRKGSDLRSNISVYQNPDSGWNEPLNSYGSWQAMMTTRIFLPLIADVSMQPELWNKDSWFSNGKTLYSLR